MRDAFINYAVIQYNQTMSAQKSLKNHSSFERFDGFYRTQLLEKSSHSRSKPRIQMASSMSKSFYSQLNTDRKPQVGNKAVTLTSLKSETISQLALKKHQNKKLNRLIALIAYTITSADKAVRFLDVSSNFQADFASKLYLNDRETLLKELNDLSLDSLHDNPGLGHTVDAKSVLLQQSVMQESKKLRQQNERLKRQLASIEIETSKQHKYGIIQSKSSHNFLTTQQVSEYSALLLTKSCEFDLLRQEYDFIELEYKKMANLLRQICNLDDINDFLANIKEQSKWKIQALNTEHTVQQKVKYQQLAQESERRTQDSFVKIVDKMKKVRYGEKEKMLIQQQLLKKNKEIESISLQFIRKCEDLAQKQVQSQMREVKYSEEALKLRQYITRLQQKLANIQALFIGVNNSCESLNASTIQDYVDIIGRKIRAYDQLTQLKCNLQERNMALIEQINKFQFEVLQLNTKWNEANIKIQQSSLSSEIQSAKLQQELRDSRAVLENKQQEIKTLDVLNKKYEQDIKELQAKCNIHESQAIAKGSKMSQAQDQSLRLKELLLQSQKTIDELTQKHDLISNKYSLLKLHQLQNSQNIMKINKQLGQSRQQNQNLKASLSSKQSEITRTKNDYEASRRNHQAKLREYQQNLTCLHSIRDDLQHLLNESRQKSNETLKTYQNLIGHLRQDNETVRKQNADIKKLLQKIQEQVRGKNVSKTQSNEQMNKLTGQIERLRGQIDQNNKNYKQRQQLLNDSIGEKEAQVQNIKKELVDAQQKNQVLERTIVEYKENLLKLKAQFQQSSRIFNDHQLRLKDQVQKYKNQKSNLDIQLQRLQSILTKEVSQRQQLAKIGQEAVKESQNTISQQSIEINLLSEQSKYLSSKLSETSNQKESIQNKLQQQREQHAIQSKVTRHDYSIQVARLKKQIGAYQERLKTIQIEKIISERYAKQSVQKYQTEVTVLQQEMMQRTSMHHKEWQQLSNNLLRKQSELKIMQEKYNALTEQFKIQTQKIKAVQQERKAKQQQEKPENSQIKQELQQRQKHMEGSMDSGSNNFTDFGSYIQQKMGEDSFVSIIHSQPSFSDHSKVFDGLTPLHPRRKEEAEDQFQDFSSSQEAMYSISSHNQSVEQNTLTLMAPHQMPSKLIPSTQMGSGVPIFGETKQTSQRVEHKLRRTFSIIRDEDPVLQRDQQAPSSVKKSGDNIMKELFSIK